MNVHCVPRSCSPTEICAKSGFLNDSKQELLQEEHTVKVQGEDGISPSLTSNAERYYMLT